MAIHFVSGKPGHGKTLYCVGKIVRTLIQTERRIVTNVPLNLERLNEYIQEKFPKADPLLHERVVLLDEEQTKEFWLVGSGLESKNRSYDPNENDWRSGLGILYVLDEIHIHFNAREWMKTGKDCLHYLSQHRKLNDDILCITQSIGNVDKQFRSVAEDFSVMRNEYSAKFGPFRGRGRFTRKTYETFTGDSSRQIPFETSHFQLDGAGIASCYNTSAGVGILNDSNPNKLKPAKGIPIMLIWPVLAFVCIGLTLVPYFLSRASADHIEDNFSMSGSESVSLGKVEELDRAKVEKAGFVGPLEFDQPEPTVLVLWDGYMELSGVMYVSISGPFGSRWISTEDQRLEEISRKYIIFEGQRIPAKGMMF